MKNPYLLSAAYIVDPGYSTQARVPVAEGSSLYTEGAGMGQPWLYVPGDLEAHLMAEARARAFRIAFGVGHHGYFPPPHRSVFFKTGLVLEESLFPAQVAFEFAGALRLTINGRYIGWWPALPKPQPLLMDLGRFFERGTNVIEIMLFGTSEPTCLRPDPIFGKWVCGCDYQRWEEPQELPFVGRDFFPHQEKLPSFPITACSQDGNLYDFGVEVIGRLRLDGMAPGMHSVFRPGESEPETRYPERRWGRAGGHYLDPPSTTGVRTPTKRRSATCVLKTVRDSSRRPRLSIAMSWSIPLPTAARLPARTRWPRRSGCTPPTPCACACVT